MGHLLLSILASTLIYVVFKLFGRFEIQRLQAIVFNYWVAFGFGFWLSDSFSFETITSQSWSWLIPIEGVLFIGIFNVMALTVQKHSVTVGSVASRTAMVIPAAFFMFYSPASSFSLLKISGIALACVAVYMSTKKEEGSAIESRYLYLPILLFLGSGLIDLVIGYAQQYLMTSADEILLFIPGIFAVAGTIGTVILIISYVRGTIRWQLRDAVAGIVLGLINYASLYFIMQAIDSGILEQSVFFPVNHMGIIAAGALVGIFIFKESTSRIKLLGLALGMVAILMMMAAK
jgi:multidrug transporter EmrE-like cation transporter